MNKETIDAIDATANRICKEVCGLPFKEALRVVMASSYGVSNWSAAMDAVGLTIMVLEACNVQSEKFYVRMGYTDNLSSKHFSRGLHAYHESEKLHRLFHKHYTIAAKALAAHQAETTDGKDRTTEALRGHTDGGARPVERGAGRGRGLVVEQRATPRMGQPREGDAQQGGGAAHGADAPGERAQRRA